MKPYWHPVPQSSVPVLFIAFINNFTDERDYTLNKFENGSTLRCPEREGCNSQRNSPAKWTDGTPVPGYGAALLCYLGTLQLTAVWTVLTEVQAVCLGKWLFTFHQYLRYHIWTEHVVLDSPVPKRCRCVACSAKVCDTGMCARWDKTWELGLSRPKERWRREECTVNCICLMGR